VIHGASKKEDWVLQKSIQGEGKSRIGQDNWHLWILEFVCF
jgi:hypothetical protein